MWNGKETLSGNFYKKKPDTRVSGKKQNNIISAFEYADLSAPSLYIHQTNLSSKI